MKHSGSNVCRFSHHVTPFPMLRGCPKFDDFLEVWQLVFYRNDMVWTIRGVCMLSEVSLIIHIRLMMVMVHSISNGCLSLQYSIPFSVLKGCPTKFVILLEIWELFLAERTRCWPWGACICYQKLSQSALYIWGRLWHNQSVMMPLFIAYGIQFQCWEGAQNLTFCMKIESCCWQKGQGVDHEWFVYPTRSSSNHHYTFQESNEALR